MLFIKDILFEQDTKVSSREDDAKWPQKNKDGRQELEIRLGSEHISFEVYQLLNTTVLC